MTRSKSTFGQTSSIEAVTERAQLRAASKTFGFSIGATFQGKQATVTPN